MYRLLVVILIVSVFVSPVSWSQGAPGPPDYITIVRGDLEPERIPPYEAAWTVFAMLRSMSERDSVSTVSRRVGLAEEAIPALIAQIDATLDEFDALLRRHNEESCDEYRNSVVTTAAEYVTQSRRRNEEANTWREEHVEEILFTLDTEAVAALQKWFAEMRRNMTWGTLDYEKFAASPGFDLAKVYAGVCDTVAVER